VFGIRSPLQAAHSQKGEAMTDSELRQVKDRAKVLERVADNLKQEMQTIDVLAQHMLSDVRQESPARLAAAVAIGEAIQRIAETYR
jgi:hypothetical protein